MSNPYEMAMLLDALPSYSCLEHDITIIIYMSNSDRSHELDPKIFITPKNLYNNPLIMYKEIEKIVTRLGHSSFLLEMMPYIDDYLSIYF